MKTTVRVARVTFDKRSKAQVGLVGLGALLGRHRGDPRLRHPHHSRHWRRAPFTKPAGSTSRCSLAGPGIVARSVGRLAPSDIPGDIASAGSVNSRHWPRDAAKAASALSVSCRRGCRPDANIGDQWTKDRSVSHPLRQCSRQVDSESRHALRPAHFREQGAVLGSCRDNCYIVEDRRHSVDLQFQSMERRAVLSHGGVPEIHRPSLVHHQWLLIDAPRSRPIRTLVYEGGS